MPREVAQWRGASDDARVPARVKMRIFERQCGICPICGRLLRYGHMALDHTQALILGGENSESNLQFVCKVPCHSDKTRADVKEKSRSYRRRATHAGIRRTRKPMPGAKDSLWKKTFNRGWVRRDV
jgi:5-methylcytosine-specific restriction endonuclease McrA